ncbi:M48 family metalloprotease [Orenia marismortui]|uniref:M48 family metalloprotease n=1 Tax=Orenia marismortui TaxID=46469 RepID=UPI000376C250|nr:M48 family metalloprotease [Orenia marismortui]
MESLYKADRRSLAKKYNYQKDLRNIYYLISKIILILIFLKLNLEIKFYELLTNWTRNFDLKLISFIIGLYLIYAIFAWSLDYFLSYKLAREYRLSNQEAKEWLIDKVKMSFLVIIFIYIISRLILTFEMSYGSLWWLAFSIIAMLFILIINFIFPVILFPIFFKLTPYPDNLLRERLENLFKKAKVRVADIYEFNLSSKVNSANAAVMGLGKTRKIILGDNLIDKYSEEEIEAIMAHEIGHHAHKDIFKQLLIQFFTLVFTSVFVSKLFPIFVEWKEYEASYSIVSLPLLIIIWGGISWLISPIPLYISRKSEEQADEFAFELIANPRNFATAMAKLADESLSNLKFGWYKLLFKASHPPIGQRIEKALEWDEKNK